MVDKEITVIKPNTMIIRKSNPEKYYEFLEERINSHAIGSKFTIPYYADYDTNDCWDIAEFEGYIAIKYSYGDINNGKARIEILKHYEEPFSEICSKYYN